MRAMKVARIMAPLVAVALLGCTAPPADDASAQRGAPPPLGLERIKLPGIVVDDAEARRVGPWEASTSAEPCVGTGYLHDDAAAKGTALVAFELPIPAPGGYELRLAVPPHANRARRVPVTVATIAGPVVVYVDQAAPPPILERWISLGIFRLAPGASVTVSNASSAGTVVVDAVQALLVAD